MLKQLGSIVALFTLLTAFTAAAGPRDGGGGDILRIAERPFELLPADRVPEKRLREVRDYLASGKAREDLIAKISHYMDYRSSDLIQFRLSTKFHEIGRVFDPLDDLSMSFLQDIRNAPYALLDSPVYAWCGQMDGTEKDAATCGQRLGEVRFNLHRIARYRVSWEQLKLSLQQLVFHEHVRHFGFADNDHALAKKLGLIDDPSRARAEYLELLRNGDSDNDAWQKLPHLIDWYRIDYIQGGYDAPATRWVDEFEPRGDEREIEDLLRKFESAYRRRGFAGFSAATALEHWRKLGSVTWFPSEGSHRLANAICRARSGEKACPTEYSLGGPEVFKRDVLAAPLAEGRAALARGEGRDIQAIIKICGAVALDKMRSQAQAAGLALDDSSLKVDSMDARADNPSKYIWFKARARNSSKTYQVMTQWYASEPDSCL